MTTTRDAILAASLRLCHAIDACIQHDSTLTRTAMLVAQLKLKRLLDQTKETATIESGDAFDEHV